MKLDNKCLNDKYFVKKTAQNIDLFKSKHHYLNHIDIELTERCNNACIHCYINLQEDHLKALQRELTTDQWKDILQQAADLGALSVRFTGGEPLLREDFTDIYLFARRLGMKVYLFTNARLISEELADLFKRVPPLKKIEVSVYGMHPQSYDSVVNVRGAFKDFEKGIKLLLDREIPFIVKSVLLPPNRGEIQEFESWAYSLPDMERITYSIFLDLRTRRDSFVKNKLIKSLRFSPEEGLELLTRNETEYRKSMANFASNFLYPQGDMLFDCGAGESGCVDAYGKYQMCMQLRHPNTVYDLNSGSLREALTEFFPRLRQLHATNPEYLIHCARCFLKGICEQCPAKSWSEHGTLDTPVEYLCQVAHVQARFLGLLEENEFAWNVKDWKSRINKFVSETLNAEPTN